MTSGALSSLEGEGKEGVEREESTPPPLLPTPRTSQRPMGRREGEGSRPSPAWPLWLAVQATPRSPFPSFVWLSFGGGGGGAQRPSSRAEEKPLGPWTAKEGRRCSKEPLFSASARWSPVGCGPSPSSCCCCYQVSHTAAPDGRLSWLAARRRRSPSSLPARPAPDTPPRRGWPASLLRLPDWRTCVLEWVTAEELLAAHAYPRVKPFT